MRALFSKVLTGSIVAGAALAVSACGPKTETTTTTDNTMVTDMGNSDMGTMSDNMTAVDGGMNGGMMANDSMMGNDSMMSTNTMTTTTTTNAM